MKRRYRAIGNPTAEQQRHQDAQRMHGCAMCILRDNERQGGATEIHHLTCGDLHGQKQMGQEFTVALCSWHHRGAPLQYRPEREMRGTYGPSFALHKRAFMDELIDRLGERSMKPLQAWQDSRIEWRRAA